MSTTEQLAIAVGIALIVGYPIFMRALAQAMQPSRLKMLDIGLKLLADDRLPSDYKRRINSMLDDAYDPRFMMFLAVIMPYYAVARIMGRISVPELIDNREIQQLNDEFWRRYIAAVAAANPAFTVVAAAEMAILAIVLFPLGQLWRTQDVQFGTVQAVDRVLHRRAA